MKIAVVRLSDDELNMEEFTFVFHAESLIFYLRKFTVHHRSCETSPWVENHLWKYPDPHKEGSQDMPEIPDWAEDSARSQITSKFKFQI